MSDARTLKAYNSKDFGCQIININELKEKVRELEIYGIDFTSKISFYGDDVEFTDMEHPITYVDSPWIRYTLFINLDYFKGLENELEEILIDVLKNYNSFTLTFTNASLLTNSVLEAIRDNPNITNITLGSENDVFTLNEYWYQEFSKVGKCYVKTYAITDNLKDNYDTMIVFNRDKKLIKDYTLYRLKNLWSISFDESLTELELENFKYLDKELKVNINYNDNINVIKILNRLKEVGHTGDVFINIEDKNIFNSFVFSNLEELKDVGFNVNVYYKNESYNLLKYLKYEKILIDLVEPAVNMSPFEKFLYAYNVAKNYKPYKESKGDKLSARRLYSILDNEYMVCVGYSVLLGDLLNKLGIESLDYIVSVDCGLDEIKSDTVVLPEYILDKQTGEKKEVLIEGGKHARRIIHLIDPKYDIDGYYFSDPTWDNDDKVDTYNYALMTNEEYIGNSRYNYFDTWNFDELLFVKDLEDFYNKINVMLTKNPKKNERDVISFFADFFKEVDKEFYLKLVEFNNGITKNNYKFSKEEIQDLFLFIGEHLLEKVDNLVDGHTFKEGITEIYRTYHIGNEEELEEKVNEVMRENKRCYDRNFPMRYKIDKDDNSLVILNPYNKFDLENEPNLGI